MMYDAQTQSHWSQLVGEAISGAKKGSKLRKLPSTMTTWGKWKALHPETTVYVKRSTPYHARFTREFFSKMASSKEGPVGDRDLVVGVEGHIAAKAYLARYLARQRVVNDTLESGSIVVFMSEDRATVRVLNRTVGDRILNFSLYDKDRLRDAETGSVWDPLTGRAILGPLEGQQMSDLISTFALWFAWHQYRPDTVLIGGM